MPFAIVGIISGSILFSIIPWMNVFWGFLMVIIFFNIAMAFYRAPVIALMPDYTPENVRSTGNAIIQLNGRNWDRFWIFGATHH